MIYLKGVLSGLAPFFIAQVVCFWPSLQSRKLTLQLTDFPAVAAHAVAQQVLVRLFSADLSSA